jgi:dTDP-4-amino-4,6-dideoxygalactose transaminase
MKRSVAKKFIPYGRQSISPEDIRAVTQALRSDHLRTGPRVRQFEEKLAAYCGARFAVVCSSGTAALHLACLALGLKEKDAIVTSPITFLATANCARYPSIASADKCRVVSEIKKAFRGIRQ